MKELCLNSVPVVSAWCGVCVATHLTLCRHHLVVWRLIVGGRLGPRRRGTHVRILLNNHSLKQVIHKGLTRGTFVSLALTNMICMLLPPIEYCSLYSSDLNE